MIDAEIELVQHPSSRRASGGGIAKQRERLIDQVFVVEQAAAFFLGAITVNHGGGDCDQRLAAVTRTQGEFTREEMTHTFLFSVEPRGPLRISFGQFFGQYARTAFAVISTEYIQITFDALASRGVKGGGQRGSTFTISLGARREHVDQCRPFSLRDS